MCPFVRRACADFQMPHNLLKHNYIQRTLPQRAALSSGRPGVEAGFVDWANSNKRRLMQMQWGISAVQCQLLFNGDPQVALQAALRTAGKALGLDQIYMARHEGPGYDASGAGLQLMVSWKSPRCRMQFPGRKPLEVLNKYYAHGYDRLKAGKVLDDLNDSAEPEMIAAFEKNGIKSILLLPVMVNDNYWGLVGLESVQPNAPWSHYDDSVLKQLIMSLGSIVEKSNMLSPTLESEAVGVSQGAVKRLELESCILAQVSEAIAAVDLAGNVCFFNSGAEVIFGLSANEVIGQPVATLTRNRSVQYETDAGVMRALEERGSWSGRDTLILKDWRTREVTLSITPLDDKGKMVGFIAVYRDVLRDVTANRQQELRIEHRLRVESALVEASQKLVSDAQIDFEQLLGLMGEAVGAESVYFVEIPSDKHLLQEVPLDNGLNALPRVWKRQTPATDDNIFIDLGPGVDSTVQRLVCKWNGKKLSRTMATGEQTALAVPVLSPHGKLHGYLGVEYGGRPPEWQEADSRVLSVLGDLLSTYFERLISEEALRASEERYRTFVDTTSEAIWRIELEGGVHTALSSTEQVKQVGQTGCLAECNRVMAVLLGKSSPEKLIDKPFSQVMPHLEVALIEEFVHSGYRLLNHEYAVSCGKETSHGDQVRHFVINAVGTVKEEKLVRIWGSCVEVTERVRLEQQMVETLEEQQQRIGRDLHDGVGQLMTGVRMLSQNLAEKLKRSNEESSHTQAQKIATFAEEASKHVRQIYRGLTPTQLFHEGLATALNELSHNTSMLPGVTCSYVSDGLVDVWERDTKMHMYRIAQEATNNALKHADASEIQISLDLKGDCIILQVEDNGKGFDPKIRTGKSLGLNSMEYRARTIKGSFEIKSVPGSGTIVRCTIRENQVRQELTHIVHKDN